MSAEIATATGQLPVPVLSYPHWRVNFRPGRYEPELVPTRADCLKLVEQCQVSLRGWSFPFLSNRQEEREFGENYVASWVNFMGENLFKEPCATNSRPLPKVISHICTLIPIGLEDFLV